VYDENLRSKKRSIVTQDGTKTLFSDEFKESYHSDKDGALNESLQKHILSAFRLKGNQDRLTILDICFGLGYNTLATIYHIKRSKLSVKVHIVSPEFDSSLVGGLSNFDYPQEFAQLKSIINTLSKELYYEDEQFKIEIFIENARETILHTKERFDIVYQDPFSPSKNPLLWTREYFAQIRNIIKDDGILTTYSVASSVRMGLYENGFHLFELSGKNIRDWMMASPKVWDSLDVIDMELKKERNPKARSLRDKSFEKMRQHER
jgi:tRNA U34 5-methylaminomethyl-2-thiouridine-forming methyltransferase MnmC